MSGFSAAPVVLVVPSAVRKPVVAVESVRFVSARPGELALKPLEIGLR